MAVIVRDCPHCPATHSSMTIQWEKKLDGRNYIVTATCGACAMPVSFRVRERLGTGYAPMKDSRNIEGDAWAVERQWPKRTDAIAPLHVPGPVARRFLEGEEAYARHSWNAAVAMYRSALDIATKALPDVPAGQTFYKRLAWLHDHHRITPDMKDWADHVRIEGNDALHDEDEYTEADAKPLRLFTEMFLKYVFELPGEVRAFRTEAEDVPAADA